MIICIADAVSPLDMADRYWEYAQRKNGQYPAHTARGGKWLIFVRDSNLNSTWTKVKTAVEQGKLGSLAKAPNRKRGSLSRTRNSNYNVICVYTYDWQDRQDVKRIREELRKIGISRKIPYKTDEDTERGIYRSNSSAKISKYYE